MGGETEVEESEMSESRLLVSSSGLGSRGPTMSPAKMHGLDPFSLREKEVESSYPNPTTCNSYQPLKHAPPTLP